VAVETLGFTQVFDYADGKLDWMAAAFLPKGPTPRSLGPGDLARDDTPNAA